MSERKLERSHASSAGRTHTEEVWNEDENTQGDWERLKGGDLQAALKWLRAGGPLHPRSSHSAAPDDSRDSQGQDRVMESKQVWLRVATECINKILKCCEKSTKDRTVLCMVELLARLSHAAESPSGLNSQTIGVESEISVLMSSPSLRIALSQRLQQCDAEEALFILCIISTGVTDVSQSSVLTTSTINDALLQVSQRVGNAVAVLQQSSSSSTAHTDLSPACMLISAFVRNVRCRRVMEAGCEEAQDLVSSLLQAVTAFCNNIFGTAKESRSGKDAHIPSSADFSDPAADCMESLSHLVSSRLAFHEMSMGLWQHAVNNAIRSLQHSNTNLSSAAASLLSSFARGRAGGGASGAHAFQVLAPADSVVRLHREMRKQRERHVEEICSLRAKLSDAEQTLALQNETCAAQQKKLAELKEKLEEVVEEREAAVAKGEELEGRLEEEEQAREHVEGKLRGEEAVVLELKESLELLQKTLEEREQRVDTLSRKLCMLAGSHKDQAALIAKQTQQLRASKSVTSAIQKLASGLSLEAS